MGEAYMVRLATNRWRQVAGGLAALIIGGAAGAWAQEAAPAAVPVAPAPAVAVAAPVLKPGARVAIVGDSITEQKLYSRYIELYLRACVPELACRVMQYGWGGETARGFNGRLETQLLPFKPTVVTTCYGMNDGGYRAFSEDTGRSYRAAMEELVQRAVKAGAVVVVGSPGAVDTKYFARGGAADAAAVYNDTLGRLRDIDREIAAAAGMPFADVHAPMLDAMAKGKEELGADYDVGGRDGVHPGPNGHVAMAYAFLKALGVDGEIGRIVVDLTGETTASGGHKVLSANAGTVELESSRWPFCFAADGAPNAARTILPFLPFQQDLNRLVLQVQNLAAEKAKVTWGDQARECTRAELEAGVNLADAFLDNPFSVPFQKLDGAVAAKQSFETDMIKRALSGFDGVRKCFPGDAEADAALTLLAERLWRKQAELDDGVRALVVPVRHTLKIEPLP